MSHLSTDGLIEVIGIPMRNLGELLEFRGVGRGQPYEDLKWLPRPSVLDSGHSPRCREALVVVVKKLPFVADAKNFQRNAKFSWMKPFRL